GEGMWPMPMPEELLGDLDSPIADLANITGHRHGCMLAAAQFLSTFVADGVRWAHIDMAGPAFNNGEPWGYTPKGGTGVPVRTLPAVAEDTPPTGGAPAEPASRRWPARRLSPQDQQVPRRQTSSPTASPFTRPRGSAPPTHAVETGSGQRRQVGVV